MTITALFEGNDPSALATAQALASGAIAGVSIFTGQASWQDYTGSVGWEEGLWSGFGGVKLWSIPLYANGSNLPSAAQGAYDAYYTNVAQTLANGQSSGPIYVRTGWEFNGSWEAWYAKGQESSYVGAFQQFVDTFRAVSNRFVFTWAPSIGDQGMDPSTAYPGDKYVDIIGDDFYWNTQYYSADPGAAWSSMVHQTYGLQWLENFAAAHGKPTAYPEWGVESTNAAPYIAAAADWFSSHNVAYQSYWDSNADFPGKLSDGHLPDVAAAYLTAFTGPHAATSTATTTSATTTAGATSSTPATTAPSTSASTPSGGSTDTVHDGTAAGSASSTSVGSVSTAPVTTTTAPASTPTTVSTLPASVAPTNSTSPVTTAPASTSAETSSTSATDVLTQVSVTHWIALSGLVSGGSIQMA